MAVTVKAKSTGQLLASAELGAGVDKYEGYCYFDPSQVSADSLRVTERTYTCPSKGTCNWVDFITTDGSIVKDVAWVYPSPKPGHELVKGRYGFYSGSRGGTVQEG